MFPKILISFKKLKIFSGNISLNNMPSDLAVKWLSLISIKSEQVSKICSMVKRLSHPMHIGGSSPFNKKEWVRKKKNGQCAIGPSQFLLFCFSEDKIYILLILGIFYIIYFLGTHPTQTATILIYIYLCVFLGLRMGWAQSRCFHQGHP